MTNAVIGALRVNLGMDTAEFENGAKRGEVVWDRFGKSLKGGQKNIEAAQGSISNLAAQFQDIGVQLAGGQSPFLIALQQGTQISSVLGQSGAAGAVGLLSGAFTSLLSPVSLATIAIIAGGGAAVQYFAQLLTDGEKAELTLEQQAQLIQQLAKQWGDAVPAIKAYADELERTKNIADLQQGVDIINARTLEDTRTSIEAASIDVADLVSKLQAAGAETEIIKALQQAFNEFSSAAKDGSLNLDDVKRVQDALAAAVESTGIPALGSFNQLLESLSESALKAASSVQQLNAQTGAAITSQFPSQGSYSNVDRSADGQIQGESFPLPEQPSTPTSRPLIELTGMDWLPKEGKRGQSEAEKQAKAYERVTQALQDELSMIGQSETAKRILNSQRRAGVDAASAEGVEISNLITQIDQEKQTMREAAEVNAFFRDSLTNAFADLVPEIETGNKALDNFLNTLIKATTQALLFGSGPLGSVFGGSGGSLLGSLFSDLPGFATGGTILPGGTGGIDSQVVAFRKSPTEQVDIYDPRTQKSGGAGGITYAPVIDARGADTAAVARLEAVMAKQQADFRQNVVSVVRDANKRRAL